LRPESIDDWKTVGVRQTTAPLASRDFARNFPHQIEIHHPSTIRSTLPRRARCGLPQLVSGHLPGSYPLELASTKKSIPLSILFMA